MSDVDAEQEMVSLLLEHDEDFIVQVGSIECGGRVARL